MSAKIRLILSIVLLFVANNRIFSQNIRKAFVHAEAQSRVMLVEIQKAKEESIIKNQKANIVSPRSIENGKLKLVAANDWTSGFFPGSLWYLYEYSKDVVWLKAAKEYTAKIEQEKLDATTHDVGFKVYCSFGNAYRLTKNPDYKAVLIQAAKTLACRFNPKVGAIRSWDFSSDKWNFPVIMDNMLNLELLFEATRLTGDSSFHKIAVAHANTTLKNHFRSDYSSYHLVSYNPETGAVEKKQTHQGYSDQSTWARGEAWALYGYTMCYRYTKNEYYLDQANHIANYIFTHKNMPADLIPYWDFDAPNIPNEPRDASAAAIIASGLYELSSFTGKAGKVHIDRANKILANLASNYTSSIGKNSGFILIHSTGSKPHHSEIDAPLSYADYYYLEALLRKKAL